MNRLIAIIALVLTSTIAFSQKLPLNKASKHLMQYYLSLPKQWSADKKWPILLVLESANKEFEKNAQLFIDNRGDLPFIIIAPVNVNNGNMGRKDPTIFPYSAETWNEIDRVGDCKFNMDGILTIVDDVQKKYNGEKQIYATGFEAGTHALWPLVFQHPELLKAAVPVSGNYNSRSCTDLPVSDDPSKKSLIIKAMYGASDEYAAPAANGKSILYNQYMNAKALAVDHGYGNISEQAIPNKSHEPLVPEIFQFLKTLL
jgi:predicted peptidase